MQGVGVELVTVGNKGSTYFKKRQPGSEGKGVKTTVRASYACGQGPTAEEATTIANEARRRPSHVARGRESEHSIHPSGAGGRQRRLAEALALARPVVAEGVVRGGATQSRQWGEGPHAG